MTNEAQVSLSGYIATPPSNGVTRNGESSVRMRMAWTERRRDWVTHEWSDGATSYLTIWGFGRLAENAYLCLHKGDPIVVRGRMVVREYEDKSGVSRVAVDVRADSLGLDLSHGVARFQRVRPAPGLTALDYEAAGLSEAGRRDEDLDEAAFARLAASAAVGRSGQRGRRGADLSETDLGDGDDLDDLGDEDGPDDEDGPGDEDDLDDEDGPDDENELVSAPAGSLADDAAVPAPF
jgi:single-strand DNA-binding protein